MHDFEGSLRLTVALSPDVSLQGDGCVTSSWGEVLRPAAGCFRGGTPPALGSNTAHGCFQFLFRF